MKPLPTGSYETVDPEHYETPKEMWGFRTGGSAKHPEARAREFLAAHHDVFGVPENLRGIRHQKTIESLGAFHVIFQQWHRGRRVHRAYMTVHMDKKGRVYLAKNRVMPKDYLPEGPFAASKTRAIAAARASLPKKPGPPPKGMKTKPVRRAFFRGTEERWYPVGASAVPALRVRLERRRPTETWVVYVNATTGKVIDKYDSLARAVTGRAKVFDPNPVTALGGHDGLIRDERHQRTNPIPAQAYQTVTLYGLRGNGRLEGRRVTTRPTGRKHRVSRKHHVFELDSSEKGFEEVMAYYHIDAAIRYLENDLGYRGSQRIFKKPVRVNVNGTRDDNSWYEGWNQLLTLGTGYIDDAEDGEIILHELGHAIQSAIVPNWGASAEAGAMGEGFGDYFAASFFYDRKPPRYRRTMMSWNGLFDGLWYWRRAKTRKEKARLWPPAQRYMDDAWTYRHFNEDDDEHENGKIWAAVLWDIFKSVGRDVADRIIIDSHFQLDPYTNMARGARAILDADHNLFGGAHARKLGNVFKKREIEWEE